MKIHTKSRDDLYDAKGIYENNKVVVICGSRINLRDSKCYNPPKNVADIRENRDIVDSKGILLQDVIFETLSTAATFVTGRNANGMIVWKTDNGKYVRYALNGGDDNG